jgi:SAM-dependent methyltransferase
VGDWDERYRRGEHATQEPSRVLVRTVEILRAPLAMRAGGMISGKRALDLACGAGRHAIFLAGHGFEVTAVDSSRVGIEMTRRRAAAHGLPVDARIADLERGGFRIEPGGYDLICDFYYLQRDLFPSMRAGVREGGLVAAAIHLTDERADASRPMNPDFLLQPGELLSEFEGWEILHYHETSGHDEDAGDHTRRTAELIARRPV